MNITVTLFAQMIAFGLLIWFVNKVLWAPLSGMMNARQKRIADGLAAAEKGKHEQELAEKRAKDVLQDAKGQAAEIVAQAQKRSSEIVEEAKGTARDEGERILNAAKAEIGREANQAREQLRGQLASVAVVAAEKILNKEVDAAVHSDMLNELAAKI